MSCLVWGDVLVMIGVNMYLVFLLIVVRCWCVVVDVGKFVCVDVYVVMLCEIVCEGMIIFSVVSEYG